MISKTGFAIGISCFVIAGCVTSSPVEGSTSEAVVSAPTSVWVSTQGGYGNQCECVNPPPGQPCACVQDQCNGDPDGQACSTVGVQCNVIDNVAGRYEVLECENVPPPPNDPYVGPFWIRTSTDTCDDVFCYRRHGCVCLTNLCAGGLENQRCSTPGASCNVVTGSTWFELTCQ